MHTAEGEAATASHRCSPQAPCPLVFVAAPTPPPPIVLSYCGIIIMHIHYICGVCWSTVGHPVGVARKYQVPNPNPNPNPSPNPHPEPCPVPLLGHRAVPKHATVCFALSLLKDRPPVLGSVTGQPPSVTSNRRQLEANCRLKVQFGCDRSPGGPRT